MKLNYKENNKKLLRSSNKYDKMNIESFAEKFEREQKMPESVRGNAQWVKDMYSEIEARPTVSTADRQNKDGILTSFAKEAESIFKLDAKNRELPTIKELCEGSTLWVSNLSLNRNRIRKR